MRIKERLAICDLRYLSHFESPLGPHSPSEVASQILDPGTACELQHSKLKSLVKTLKVIEDGISDVEP